MHFHVNGHIFHLCHLIDMCQTFSTYSIAFSQPFLTNVILFLQLSSPGISLTFASSGKYVSICYKNTAYNIMVCFKDNNPEFKILTFLAPSKSTLFFFICVSDKNVWTSNRNLFRKKNSISKDVDTVGSTYFFFELYLQLQSFPKCSEWNTV